MSHDHVAALPPIPFSDAEFQAMYAEDKSAAWNIACLTGGIFTFGLALYIGVLAWSFAGSPMYIWR